MFGDKTREVSLRFAQGQALVVILSAAKDLCVPRARPFPFAEFTLERSEGLKVTGIFSKCLGTAEEHRHCLRHSHR